MSASIVTRLNTHYNRHNIARCKYPYRNDVEPITETKTGEILPPTKGYPAKFDLPGISFKTYRSIINWGHKKIANYVIQNRKRSFITPNSVWNGIMAFGGTTPRRPTLDAYTHALAKVREALRVEEKLPVLNMVEAVQSIPRSTSPGLPWIINTPGLKKGDIVDRFLPSIQDYWNRVGSGKPTEPLPDCAAFARSHISTPDKNKVRAVWAYPMHAVCQEARFTAPLIHELKDQRILRQTAYGMEMMKGGMAWLHSQALRANSYHPGAKYFMVDFSAFDSSVPAWLIRDSFYLIAEKFDFSKVQIGDKVLEVDPVPERRKFQRIINYFINTTIRNSDGKRFRKTHGVPSGSMFTNIIDTIVNLIVTYTLCDCVFDSTPIFEVVFGDDGFICLPDSALVDVDAYAQTAMNLFGMTVSPTKSYVTRNLRNIHFLGYFNNFGSPVKNPVDLIASMLYPQHVVDDWSYCISRALGCILAGAGSSSEVFLCGRAVWHYASRFPHVLDEGLRLIKENPRSRRFLDQMGCGDLPLSHEYFEDITLSCPSFSCSKMTKNVNLVKRPLL